MRMTLQNPGISLEVLNGLLDAYSVVSGYKINDKKYVIMGLNITEWLKGHVQTLTRAELKQRKVCYLGIKVLDTPQYRLADNLVAYINNLLTGWNKLGISWLVKMKILLVILFLFQNLLVPVQMQSLF